MEDNEPLSDALKLFQIRVISMLPVLKNGRLVGIVTDGDAKKASPSDATSLDRFEMDSFMDKVAIKTVMSKPVETIQEDHTVDEATGSNPVGRTTKIKGFQLSLETFFDSNWVTVPKIVPNCVSRYASCLCAASFKSSSLTILYRSKTDLVL
jgi:hypothetical protein